MGKDYANKDTAWKRATTFGGVALWVLEPAWMIQVQLASDEPGMVSLDHIEGRLLLTPEQAEAIGVSLTHAAACARQAFDPDQPPTIAPVIHP